MTAEERRAYWRDYAREKAAERRAFNAAGIARPKKTSASGIDYVRMAEEIVAPGKAPEELSRAEQDRAVTLAVQTLKNLGLWPASDPRHIEAQRRRSRKAA